MSAALKNKIVLFFIAGHVATTIEQDLIDRLENEAAIVKVRSLLGETTYGSKTESCYGVAYAPGTTVPSAYSDTEDFPNVTPATIGTSVTLTDGDSVPVLSAAGTAQVETATAAGTITAAGNATVIVTSAALTGSPITVSVAVLLGDTASQWAAKVRTALGLNTTIKEKFVVGGSGTAISLTRRLKSANDATLNISLDNGTCTGITTAASSANTTAGVAPTVSSTGTAAVQEGVAKVVA